MKGQGGLPLPWVFVRRRLAQAWGIPPWDVDDVAVGEIAVELELMALDAEGGR
jgi:hypothetical protein